MTALELAGVVRKFVGVDRLAAAVFEQGYAAQGAAERYAHRLPEAHGVERTGPELRTQGCGEQIDVVAEVDFYDGARSEHRAGEMQHDEACRAADQRRPHGKVVDPHPGCREWQAAIGA